ncbi:MAG TPA: sugar phosphate isomerase/epimerase family protein [Dongiaceae bacterium]|nr:sugar phosphate isomerase/epimerase family protein [Dongiaceae bacterium]
MSAVHLFQQSYSYRHHYLHQPGFDVFRFLEIAAADGFTGVSINANGANYRQLSGTSDAHLQAVRQSLERLKLRCDLETSDTAPAHMETMLRVGQDLGIEQLRTYMRHGGSVVETIAHTIVDLKEVARLAEQAGIRVLLENHEDFTGPELATILAAVDSPWVAALYDYGNSMMVGEQPLTALEAILPFVRSAHLKDHVCIDATQTPDGQLWVVGVPIGSGFLPIVDITRRLVARGLDRLIMSSVWGYHAPIRDRRGDGAVGQGVFAFAQPPFDPVERPIGVDDLAKNDPARLVAQEFAAVQRGQSWLRQALDTAGITVIPRD